MFSVMLHAEVTARQGTPMLLPLPSASPANGPLIQIPVNSVKSFLRSSEQTPKSKSLANTPAEIISLLHRAGQEQ